MDIGANQVTNVQLGFQLWGVNWQTGFHARNRSLLTYPQWSTDVAGVANAMLMRMLNQMSTSVTFYQANFKVIDEPEIPTLGIPGTGAGVINSPPSVTLIYLPVNMYTQYASTFAIRNTMRLSGYPSSVIDNNCMAQGWKDLVLDQLRMLVTDSADPIFDGFSTWDWVATHLNPNTDARETALVDILHSPGTMFSLGSRTS